MELRIGLLCLLLVYVDITHSAAPVCKSGCLGQNNNVLKLQEGTTYVYNFEGKTETSVPKTKGPNGDSTKLNIRAKVEVNVQAKCAALIRLKNVQITGPDEKKYSSLTDLEKNPVRVGLNGGALAPQICSVPEDDYTSLNIKRAIASLLQVNTAESTTIPQEVDVFGACPTNYNIRQDGGVTVVQKNRDLNKCAYRENIRQEIFSIPTAGNSELQSSPLLEPTYAAEIRIKGGIVESALADESYLLRPFSDKANGVKVKITTKLTLESKAAGSIPDTTKEPRSIIFENPHEIVTSSIQSVLAALHKVADITVGIDGARNVAELVAIIRRASADDLLSVYGQVKAGAGFKNKNLAKKAFTDALFRSGSGDSISVAVELLKSREIVGDNAKLWFLSFALARHVSSKALEKAAGLLDDNTLPNEAYLGIGALAGKYCREHVCDGVPQFEGLLKKLAGPLSAAVPQNRQDENKVVAALKALRNVKKLSDDVANKVAGVIKESKAPARVRVAALETAASDACKNKLQKAAADVLNDREEDSELRIKAYLVLVECPNPKTANKLSEMLENENVNQVGAFITSHLRNLRASAKPDRQEAKALLQNVKPIRRYPIDIRKFSQNYELSYDIDALGSSASADASVIFSQKSYLPRSANLNLTAEFFGHAFNLFEINGRAENLERVFESFFGPKGYLRNTKPEDIIKDRENELRKLKQQLDEKYKRLTRSKRSVTRENIDGFGEKVKLHNSELDDNLDVDVSLRLLGNELLWVNLGEKSTSPEEVINKVAEVLERGFGDTKDFDQRIQNHAVLLDSELAYPTSTGLPLKLTATGTSVVHLKVAGSLDLAALLKDPKKGEAKIEVRPSASVEIVGQVSIDGYAVEAGVKLAATLHTATGSEVTVKLLDGQGIDLNIGLPIKESDILTVQTEVLIAVRERGQPQSSSLLEFQVPRKDFQGCFDQLLSVTGLTLCGSVGFPNDPQAITSGAALYPLNGHSKLSLRLDKEDESLTTYHFRLQYSLTDPTNRRIEALIETPGSKNPREISLLAEAKTTPNKEINVKLITPFYKLRGQALITESSSEYSLSGLAELEGVFSYKARLGVLINGDVYTPIIEYTPIDDKQPKIVKVEGTVSVEKAGPGKRTYKFNNVRLITTNPNEVSIDGTVTRDVNLFQTDLKVGYGKQNIGVKTKLQRQGNNNLKVNVEISPSQYPDFGFGLKYDYQRDKTHVENSLSIVHGRDLASKQARLSIFQHITYNIESVYKFDVSTKNTLTYPLFAVEGKFEGAATDKSVHYDLFLGYEKNTITSKLNVKTAISKPGDYAVDFSASALEHGVKFEAKRSITAANKSKFTNKLTVTPGGEYSLDADVTHQLDKNNIDTRLDVTVKIEGSSDPYKLDIGLLLNPQERGAHSKISLGANDLLDAEIKQKTETSGSFRLNIRKALESNGKYTLSANKAVDADVLFNIIPIHRKIKGTAKLTVNAGNYVGTIDVLYDADKDPSKKISVKTETLIGARAINSKNKISEGGRDILLSFNAEAHGKLGNGGVGAGYDITLPNGLHLVARSKQSLRLVPGNSDAEVFLEIGYSLQAGKPLTKITLDTSARNVDLNRYSFDTKFETAFSCEHGDAYYKQSARSTPSDGKLLIELQNSLGGSRLGEWQYNGKTKITANKAEVSYHTTAALSTKYSLDVHGKLHPGIEDRTHGLEQTITIKTPAEGSQNIKLVTVVKYVQGDKAQPCQLKLNQEVNYDGKVLKLGADGTGSKTEGKFNGNLELPGLPTYNGQVKYKHNHENELIKSEVDVEGSQDGKKINFNLKADYTKDVSLLNIHLTGATPFEKAKKLDISGNFKKVSAVAGNLDAKASVNDDTAELAVKYDLTTNHLLLDETFILNGKKDKLYIKWDRKTDRSGRLEEQVIWSEKGGGQWDSVATYDLESLENFLISATITSEKLNLNKLKIDFGNRPSKSGAANKVNLSATDKDGKILSGSASYAVKDDESGWGIEGKGSVTYKNENYPLTYKIKSSRLSKNVNNEIGGESVFVVDFDKGKYDFKVKYSDKEFHYKNDMCYDKKCSGAELQHSIQVQGIAKTNAQFKISAFNDLPIFDAYKFEIVGKSQRDGLLSSSEATATLQEVVYKLHHYVRATEAAIIATVPTREIAAVANYQLPSLKQSPIVGKLDASLYLDRKKSPADKATLSLDGSVKNENKQAVAVGTVKFSHPSLQRDLTVKAEATIDLKEIAAKAGLEIDVLNKKSQKIILNAEAKQLIVGNGRNFTANAQVISKGLVVDLGASAHGFFDREGGSVGAFLYYVDDKNLKKDAGVLLSGSTKKAELLLRIPGHTLLEGFSTFKSVDDVKTIEAELTIAEGETGVLKSTITGYSEIKAALYPKSEPKRSLEGLASISKEKLELRAERKDNGKVEPLVSAVLHLDQANLLKLDYDINAENIKKPLKYFETLLKSTIDRLKAIAESLSKEINSELLNLSEALKKAQPNFKALIQQYQNTFKVIRDELEKDPNYKKLAAVFQKLFGGTLDFIEAQIKIVLSSYEKLSEQVTIIQTKLVEAYKKISPDLIDAYKKLVAIFADTAKTGLEIGSKLANDILELIRQNEADIKLMIKTASESFQDIGRITIKQVTQLRNELRDLTNLIVDQIKSLPIYENAKERIQELLNFELPPHFFELFEELSATVQDFMPTPELRELVKTIFTYIEKRLKRQSVDDVAELSAISKQAAGALDGFVAAIKEYFGIANLDTKSVPLFGFNVPIPLPSASVLRLPELGNIRISAVSILAMINEFPSPFEILTAYTPKLNIFENIPPFKTYGLILKGHHFFTFDKQQFVLKGSCSYILAQDFQDGNFSVVANLDNGKVRSLTIADKTDVVELLSDNTVILNGKPAELPINTDQLSGWRRYGSTNIKLKAGVFISNYLPSDVYVIRVSGFYFGRTRGLLGTINNEGYDEFTLPNGHIAKSAVELADAYKFGQCGPATSLQTVPAHAAECTSFFTSDSSFRIYFSIVNPAPFREACDAHVLMQPTNARQQACQVATAYVQALRQEGIPFASVPVECAQCTVNGKKLELGQTEQVTAPSGKADVVIVIEQSSHNAAVFKDLVTPLIAQLSNDLKSQSLGDAEFALIGYGGPNQKWPQHYGNNGKITYQGKSDNINFGDTERLSPPYNTIFKKIKFVQKIVEAELGLEDIVIAMTEANKYPFRAGATKIIILINSSPCSKSPLFPFSLQLPRTLNIYRYYHEHGLNFHIVSPLAGLDKKDIIGFDSEKVYSFAHPEGQTDRTGLTYADDICLSFSQYYGGTAFSSQNLISAQPEQKKKFVDTVSQRVAKVAVKYTTTEDCTCILRDGVFAIPECTVAAYEKKGR